jgi:hypothetical protein
MTLTVKHILTECGDTELIRNTYFNTKSMKDHLTNVNLKAWDRSFFLKRA